MSLFSSFPDELTLHTFRLAIEDAKPGPSINESMYYRRNWNFSPEDRQIARRMRHHAQSMRTKCSLLVVCKHWNCIAKPLLFEHVLLRRGRSTKLLRDQIVGDGSSLGQEIRIIEIYSPAFSFEYPQAAFCSLAGEIVEAAPGLLQVVARWGKMRFPRWRRYQDPSAATRSLLTSLPALQDFAWRNPVRRWAYSGGEDRWFGELMDGQRNSLTCLSATDIEDRLPRKLELLELRSLRLHSQRWRELTPLEAVNLPRLQNLDIDLCMVSLFTLDAWKHLGQSLVDLVVYKGSHYNQETLKPSEYLPSLAKLRRLSFDNELMSGGHGHPRMPDFFSPKPLPELTEISIRSSTGYTMFSVEQMESQLSLFNNKMCPALERVTVPSGTRFNKEEIWGSLVERWSAIFEARGIQLTVYQKQSRAKS